MIGHFIVTEFGTVGEITGETKGRWRYRSAIEGVAPKKTSHGPFKSRSLAEQTGNRIKSAMGERDRRLRAAHDWFKTHVDVAVTLAMGMDN